MRRNRQEIIKIRDNMLSICRVKSRCRSINKYMQRQKQKQRSRNLSFAGQGYFASISSIACLKETSKFPTNFLALHSVIFLWIDSTPGQIFVPTRHFMRLGQERFCTSSCSCCSSCVGLVSELLCLITPLDYTNKIIALATTPVMNVS